MGKIMSCCVATSAGLEWKTLNAVQKQLRRDMMPLYGRPRALLQICAGSNLKGRAYGPLFSVQVQLWLSCSLAFSLVLLFADSLFHPGTHTITTAFIAFALSLSQ